MWHDNVDLLAYHDLDGRSGLKLALQEVDGRFFLYVAGFWHSGWSILDVTDPEHPELLRFLDGPPNTMTLQVQVADGTMITALEHPPSGLEIGDPAANPKDGFLIWDVNEPDRPQLLGQWVSGATGTHRNFYNGGQWVYATGTLRGFEGQVLAIVDIADPANPKTAGVWWYPGQNKAAGETYSPEDKRRLTPAAPTRSTACPSTAAPTPYAIVLTARGCAAGWSSSTSPTSTTRNMSPLCRSTRRLAAPSP